MYANPTRTYQQLRGSLRFIWNHPLTRGSRAQALLRWAEWQALSRIHGDDLVMPFAGSAKLLVRRGMAGATGNVYCGLHEFEDMGFVLHLLRPGDLFVDVGANIGSYTILASAVCGANVVAAEPVSSTFERLRDNVRLNRAESRVDLRKVGLGNTSGELLFTSTLDDMNHVVTDSSSEPVERVAAVTLDGLLDGRAPTFLKIDVEGHEDAVITGAAQTLAKPELLGLIVEVNDDHPMDRFATQSLLRAGFESYGYEPFSRTLEPAAPRSGNTLYLRDRKLVETRLRSAPRRTVLGVDL